MHSVVETEENGYPTAVAVQTAWMKNNKLYWPPGKNIDRQTPSLPQANWLEYDCRLLKTSIGTFEEAIELEKMYSKHRDSNSFREYQEERKLKRLHPVNNAEHSKYNLIDVNDMIADINAKSDSNEHATFVDAGQSSKYHEKCVAGTSGSVKPAEKVLSSSAKFTTGKNATISAAKKLVKKPFPLRKAVPKTVLKAKSRLPDAIKPKVPRYDNFLKSGRRFDGLTGNVKPKSVVPSATITKAQSLMQMNEANGNDSDDGDSAHLGRTSTPIETTHLSRATTPIETAQEDLHRNIDFENIENDSEFVGNMNVQIRPATMTSSQTKLSFEDRVLKELSELKKTQTSFEARIERRIDNFFDDQSRLHGNGQSRLHGNSHSRSQDNRQSRFQDNRESRFQDNHHSRFQDNRQSRMSGNYHLGMQHQSRQYGGFRNEMQIRYREPVSPVRYVDDFEEFEELDKNFPVRKQSGAEALEFNIRKDIEFKFLLNSRLNEFGGSNYKKCIRLKMKYLFTDQCLDHYTWKGTEEKHSFQKLKALNDLILQSVRDRCPNTKRDEYKDYMVQWLKHSWSRQRTVTYTYPDRNNQDDGSDEDDDGDN